MQNRRSFLRNSTAAGAAIGLFHIIPSRAFGANERVVTAHVGVGGQGKGNLGQFLKEADPAAVCDVDDDHLAAAAKMIAAKGRTPITEKDYRRLLDRKDIDAVVVSTPDHWHAQVTVDACRAGKDVYCEKPLTLTIAEGRAMVQAARDNQRIVQTGSQQRSDAKFRLGCQLVRGGAIGKIREVHVGIAGSNHPYSKAEPIPDSDPPSGLDYDRWLGPAPWRAYNRDRVHYNFRFFWDYSGGQMTNWGAHHLDIAHWGLGMDASGPESVEGTATFHPQGWIDVPIGCRLTYQYADGVRLTIGQGQKDIQMGTRFIGEKGEVFTNRGVLKVTPDELSEKLSDESFTSTLPDLYRSTNHHRNFLDCVKSRQLPICDVEIGHRTATACHLGNIAMRLGRAIRWDASAEKMIGDDEAQAMTSREYRKPWSLT